jgi:hypothetical protein
MGLPMELEFDKEIDALLRKAERASPADQAAPAGSHLDADELAAFAENALPSSSRNMYVAHLADCDECRQMLARTFAAAPEEMAVAAAASALSPRAALAKNIPWYRRLLIGQQLAYTMATLIVLFSGVIGLLVYENQMASRSARVSQVRDETPAPAPTVEEPKETYSTNSSANSMANSAASSPIESVTKTGVDVGSGNVQTQPQVREEDKPVQSPVNTVNTDATTGGRIDQAPSEVPLTAAPPPAKDASVALAQRDAKSDVESADKKKADEGAVLDGVTAQRRVQSEQRQQRSNAAKLATRSVGPMAQNQTQNQIQNLPMAKTSPNVSNTRSAGGKQFTFRDGVWFDTAYSGGETKDVKRGTEKYLRLDAGLRGIADQIGGRVVVVWDGKAYKIK